MKKKRIRVEVLFIVLILLFCLFGLIARIDNSIISSIYCICILLLLNKIRKRLGIEVR